jgi:hypothetical protein
MHSYNLAPDHSEVCRAMIFLVINGKHIMPGTLIDDEVVREIHSSHVIVLFVSEAFLDSG